MARSGFDPSQHKWREVKGEPELSYKVRHDYTILGHDAEAGTLDMVVRWAGDGGHCPLHRHVATTSRFGNHDDPFRINARLIE